MYVAINKRLMQPLDELDPGFAYAVWSPVDEQYDSWIREAMAELDDGEAQGEGELPVFKCYEEPWETEARKNNHVNHFKMEEKLKGIYFYDEEADEGEEPGHYVIHALFWPKNARGRFKVWNADCTRVVQQEGDPQIWHDKLGEDGEPETAVYVVNETLYEMIQTGWELNRSKYRLVTEADDEISQ